EQTGRLRQAVTRHRDEHVVDLGRQDLVGRLGDDAADAPAARPQIPLQLRALAPYVVGPGQRVHMLIEGPGRGLGEGAGGHGRGRLYPRRSRVQPRENAMNMRNLYPLPSSSTRA